MKPDFIVCDLQPLLRKIIYRCLSMLIALAGLSGCQPGKDIIYEPRAETQKLTPPMRELIAQTLTEHAGTPSSPKLISDPSLPTSSLLAGQAVYQLRCASCHGDTGNGAGPAAYALSPKPRDYRKGIFKFISTINSEDPTLKRKKKPTRTDLEAVIRRGAVGTSMPAFPLLPDDEVRDVISYVMSLAQRGELEYRILTQYEAGEDVFEDLPQEAGGDPSAPEERRKVRFVEGFIEQQMQQIRDEWNEAGNFVLEPLSKETPFTAESVKRGEAAYMSSTASCYSCHGKDGRGMDIPPEQRENFLDEWGNVSRAADLTAGMFHGGGRAIDIYRRIMIGIEPMPSRYNDFKDNPDLVWDIVHYVQALSSARRRAILADSVFDDAQKAKAAKESASAASNASAK
ncbi:MAG: c-type cytochrome [Pirellulales bacterium]|nr:c-type cytochrome [Pirellulales bacterium]